MRSKDEKLTGWFPITEIHAVFPRLTERTLRKKAAAAQERREEWVKLEQLDEFPYQRWMIDTDSPVFQDWREQIERRESDPFADTDDDPYASPWLPALQFGTGIALIQMEESPSCRDIWPELCQWLSEMGVCVFWNTLADDKRGTWQWRWGALSGSGHASEASAILAALQTKIAQGENAISKSVMQSSDHNAGGFFSGPPPFARKRWPF